MEFFNLYKHLEHQINPRMGKVLEESIYAQINMLTNSGAFTQDPGLEATIDTMLKNATDPRLTETFYNGNYHPQLGELRSIINSNVPLSEIREKAIAAITEWQIKAAELTIALNRKHHLAESLEELGIFEDEGGRNLQCYSVACRRNVRSGFGPLVAYYDTTYGISEIDPDEEDVIYQNVALKEEVTVLDGTRFKPNTYVQLANIHLANGEISWYWFLDSERKQFLDKNNISVLSPHDDGLTAIGFIKPEDIFDLVYPLFSDSSSAELFVSAAKQLYR